jgi:ribosomal protein RSM22 (predicted rRNA methylase)
LSESRQLQLIRKLSENFTRNRKAIHEYLDDPELVSAYTSFYMTTNYPKLAGLVDLINLSGDWQKIYDFGCGPGTYLLGLSQMVGDQTQLVGIETSALMRQQAKRIFQFFWQDKRSWKVAERLSDEIKGTESGPSLAFFGHSLNEMGTPVALNYIDRVAAWDVVILGTGTKENFQQILSLRQALIERGFHIRFPCPGLGPCPMDSDNWCHQYLQIQHRNEVQSLLQKLRINRTHNPAIIHWYSRGPRTKQSVYRVIRTLPPLKFGLEIVICRGVGEERAEHLETKLILKKSRHKNYKRLLKLRPGDEIEFELIKGDQGGPKIAQATQALDAVIIKINRESLKRP